MEQIITKEYLNINKNHIFVFGDNLKRIGYGGAAILRNEPNTYGFITKKSPDNKDKSFYKPEEYKLIFQEQMKDLIQVIEHSPNKIFLISKLGAGLANKYNIWEEVIQPGIQILKKYPNVRFLF